MAKNNYLQPLVYVENLVEDYRVINAQIQIQQVKVNQMLANMPLKMIMPNATLGVSDLYEFSVSNVVIAAVMTLRANLEYISHEEWRYIIEALAEIPKSYVKDGKITLLGETRASIPPHIEDTALYIAEYLRDNDVYVPYMLKAWKVSIKVVAAVAIIYTARIFLKQIAI